MNYYRVKTGFNADDFISINESELAMALRAQITGRVGVFEQGTISGNHIISIIPDYQRAMGYHRDYHLTGEDYNYIGTKVDEHRLFFETTKTEVFAQIEGRKLLN
jgi:hypothetical protein